MRSFARRDKTKTRGRRRSQRSQRCLGNQCPRRATPQCQLQAPNRVTDTLVYVEADDGSQSLEGVIVDGQRDGDGSFDLDAEFTVFTTDDNPGGELIRVNGARCHAQIL